MHRLVGSSTRTTALERLDYFMHWSSGSAISLFRDALDRDIGTNLQGMKVLDLGSGHGRMSAFFALLGARVTAVDIDGSCAPFVQREAAKWGVEGAVDFRLYTGDPHTIPNREYDLVFTKSVLLHIDQVEHFMHALETRMAPAGIVCFLENVRRNAVDEWIRRAWHCCSGGPDYHYMNRERIAAIRRVFTLNVERLEMNPWTSLTPGWFLLCGRRADAP